MARRVRGTVSRSTVVPRDLGLAGTTHSLGHVLLGLRPAATQVIDRLWLLWTGGRSGYRPWSDTAVTLASGPSTSGLSLVSGGKKPA